MDKLSQLKQAMDVVLDDDHVTVEDDGTYTVRDSEGNIYSVRPAGMGGEWVTCGPSGRPLASSPRSHRPNEVVAWALQ